ncbi:hypothetical protein RND71_016262 [Anisodus tanguticus]|uniref:RNA-dependent RNA polymerase n=1 Tax=Anisodus tanguticus TaxID=243964 RepID=A0AAE1S5T8_9SOLA|nr:hypothetical protein RND71_016262 [Anisodus tanguticus]
MESEGSAKDLVLTQISVGGFDNDVNAKMLSENLEEQFGQVWRCRLKTSSTPPDSYPTYDIDVERVQRMNYYRKVEPHTFSHLHLQSPQSMPLVLLGKASGGVNLAALKHMFVNDAIQKLARIQRWLLKNPNLLERTGELANVVEVRRLVITPTRAYCLSPTVELSNRVLRNYKHVLDRFLRVTFMDEGMQNLNSNVLTYYDATVMREITSNSNHQRTAIFQRVKSILSNGFYLCGRKYSFLTFSANQLRDRSACFFAEEAKIRVPDIINRMGRFSDKNVAKCTARMGQCF